MMDREAWSAAVHGVTKCRTWLRDWTELKWLQISMSEWMSEVTPNLYRLPHFYFEDFSRHLVVKNLSANAGDIRDTGLTSGWGRSPGGGIGNLLQYSCLENPMDRGAWWATVCRIAKSQTWQKWLSTHTFLFYKWKPGVLLFPKCPRSYQISEKDILGLSITTDTIFSLFAYSKLFSLLDSLICERQ